MNCIRLIVIVLGLATNLLVSGSLTQALGATVNNQCNPGWYNQLETNPSTPNVGYSWFFFTRDSKIKLVLKGSFPMVRFISFQTYTSSSFTVAGALFDYQITMDRGSVNPYVPGTPVDGHPRTYTIDILPPNAPAHSPNVLRMGDDPLQEVVLRFYSPDEGVTLRPSDLPKVYAYYWANGLPAPCPNFISMPVPSAIPTGAPPPPEGTTITFVPKESSDVPMYNSAVPFYLFSYNHMALGDVAVIRFKEPSFVNTHSGTGTFPDPNGLDMRYWSLSGEDPTNAMTFGGLPDWMALPPDADGYVTVNRTRSLWTLSRLR